MNESQRRAFAALGIGPLWRLRGAHAAQADASPPTRADAPVLLALSDEAGEWLFVVEADAACAGERRDLLRADAMRLLERMLAALGLRPAQPVVALGERAGGGLGATGSASGTPVDTFAPQVIVALGEGAARKLLATDAPLAALRGRVHAWGTEAPATPLVVSAHPSQLLATPGEKAAAWADLCLARAARAQALGASSHADIARADPAGAESVSACSVRSAPPNRIRAGSPDGGG